ncbi:MAG TPA: hypothetical protein VM029_20755 [Opitutaceae bacterium]|nr:hypothetical protein [Opitutaceae bacterium]
MRIPRGTRFAGFVHRFAAAGGAVLVFALTICAASPIAHDWLHRSGDSGQESGCAVLLFADGVSLPLDTLGVQPPAAVTGRVTLASATDVFLISPRYLRQPERGPPNLG